MDALIMAGGRGARLGKDEKPLTVLCGKPLIQYVLEALLGSENTEHIFVATSMRVKKTDEWLENFRKEKENIEIIHTEGKGFVHDLIAAVEKAGIRGSVLVMMADIPLVSSGLIDRIIRKYKEMNTPALSVHMKLEVFTRLNLRPDTVFHKNGDFIVPCGINILDSDNIRNEQEDYNLILDEEELALNVNTPQDLAACEIFMENHNRILKEQRTLH